MPVEKPRRPNGDLWVELADTKQGRLSFKVSCSEGLDEYFMDDTFRVKYDKDVEGAGESILYVPAVANLAPVCWALGANLHVEELDGTFVESLGMIKNIMKGMFPGFSFAGDVCVEKVVPNHFDHAGSAQLFTGGIDSVATYALHRKEKPDLISFGIYTLFDERLQRLIFKEISDFASREGVTLHKVESNMNYTFFDHTRLMAAFDDHIQGNSWWASVQHGMGLLGICAPLTAVCDIRNLYIASSATKNKAQGLGLPWGSHPLIDGNVAWADVKAYHDCPDWCRQEKIKYAIKPFIENTGNYPRFIVCNDTGRRDVFNCGRCEKCSRTIVGLALEGIDPNRCGFHVDDRTFQRIKQKLLLRPLHFTHRKSGLWWDIRAFIPDTITDDIHGSRAFFEWLRTHEFAEDGGKFRPFSQRMLERCLKWGIIQ